MAAWDRDGTILFGRWACGCLMRVAATRATGADDRADRGRRGRAEVTHVFPHFIPDSDLFLFTSYAPVSRGELRIGSLSTGTSQALMPLSSPYVQFLPPDRVVYLHEGELRAQRIDLAAGVARGSAGDACHRGARKQGGPGRVQRLGCRDARLPDGRVSTELAWFDRAGRMLARAAEPDAAQQVVGARLSPDGTRIALDRSVDGNRDVWVLDIARGTSRDLTADPVAAGTARLVSRRTASRLRVVTFGRLEPVCQAGLGAGGRGASARVLEDQIPLDWSRDGRFLLYVEGTTVTMTDGDLFALPMTGSARTPLPIATTAVQEKGGSSRRMGAVWRIETNQSGRPEVVVQPFPDASTGAVQVSVQGGSTPRWRADGRELYFMAPDATLMAVEVTISGTRFDAGVPRPLFRSAALNWFGWFQYDVDASGRFLMSVADRRGAADSAAAQLEACELARSDAHALTAL